MIYVAKTPLRITFCGGGTDYDYFYKNYGGVCINATIDRFTYVMMKKYYDKDLINLKYSMNETVENCHQVSHEYIRRALSEYEELTGYELFNASDEPPGIGLASSSSFAVGLTNVVSSFMDRFTDVDIPSKFSLADKAYQLERESGVKCGRQDQYAVTFGGLNKFEFNQDGSVRVTPIVMGDRVLDELESSLVLVKLGTSHDNTELNKKVESEITSESSLIKMSMLQDMKDLAIETYESLSVGNLDTFAQLLNENWKLKKSTSTYISNRVVDEVYEYAMSNGATGGKLLGAGQGGCMLFYTPDRNRLTKSLVEKDLELVPFRFYPKGSEVTVI